MTRARGFTLVEMLVAVAAFGILAATAYAALDRLAGAEIMHRERSAEWRALQMAVSRLDMDLRQLTGRPARGADGRLQPALAGSGHSFTATRAGWANIADLDRSTLQRFGWQVRDNTLQRLGWPVTDTVQGTPLRHTPVLPEVELLELSYLDETGRWRETWPPDGDPAQLPRAVAYELNLGDGRMIRRRIAVDP